MQKFAPKSLLVEYEGEGERKPRRQQANTKQEKEASSSI